MNETGRRRTDRILAPVRIRVIGNDATGVSFAEETVTVSFNQQLIKTDVERLVGRWTRGHARISVPGSLRNELPVYLKHRRPYYPSGRLKSLLRRRVNNTVIVGVVGPTAGR